MFYIYCAQFERSENCRTSLNRLSFIGITRGGCTWHDRGVKRAFGINGSRFCVIWLLKRTPMYVCCFGKWPRAVTPSQETGKILGAFSRRVTHTLYALSPGRGWMLADPIRTKWIWGKKETPKKPGSKKESRRARNGGVLARARRCSRL